MKSVYFPFTYICESVARPISQFLGQPVVFQPVMTDQPSALRRLADGGLIEIQVPCSGDEDRLMRFVKEFKEWGRIHHGNDVSLKSVFKNGFYNTAFVSQIRTDILNNRQDDVFEPDPVFLSRLFLLMAQELDVSQSEIDSDLASSIDNELDLFARMTGEKKLAEPLKESRLKNDSGAYMTDSRLNAWFRLMKNSDPESAFLVTDSQAVLDQIADQLPGLEMVFSFDNISCTQKHEAMQQFMQLLTHLAVTPWASPDHLEIPEFNLKSLPKINFKLYILPNAGPMDISSFLETGEALKGNEKKWLNTLIGVFEL